MKRLVRTIRKSSEKIITVSSITVEYQAFGPSLFPRLISYKDLASWKRLIFGVMKRDNLCRKPTPTAWENLRKQACFLDEGVEKATWTHLFFWKIECVNFLFYGIYAHGILTSCSFSDLLVPSPPKKKTNIAEILPQEPEYAGAFREALTDRYLIFVNSSSASVFWAQERLKVNNLLVIYVRNFKFKEHIDDVFIFRNFKGNDTFRFRFPGITGWRRGFFYTGPIAICNKGQTWEMF